MRRAVVWVATQASRLCLLIGGLSALALIAALAMALFGEHRFPAPFSDGSAGIGRYAWQVGSMLAGAWLVWQVLNVVIRRLTDVDDFALLLGGEDWLERRTEGFGSQDTPHDGWLAPESPRR
jgi:hypothetical protein